ncbi:MAG: S8 family serine peptidase, partial [Pseudomonadota bacterium]
VFDGLTAMKNAFHHFPAVRELLAALIIGIGLIGLSGCAEYLPANADTPAARVDDRELIALVPDTESQLATLAAAERRNYALVDVTELGELDLIMLTFLLPSGVTGAEGIVALEGEVPSATVGVNHAYRLQSVEDGTSELNYANQLIAWPDGACQAQVPVGLIDSGVDVTVPSVEAARVIARDFSEDPFSDLQHGTELASVISDRSRLTDVVIYSANVLSETPDAGVAAGADDMIRALDWLASEDVRVINIALAGPFNKLLNLAVTQATNDGAIIVAAAGNAGPRAAPLYPAAFDDVIGVTAIDAAGTVYRNAVQGPQIDIAAPGVDVLVDLGGEPRFVSGTSIATPFVLSRIIADPSLARARDAASVLQALRTTSVDLGAEGRDTVFGLGLLNADGRCAG